MTTYKLTYFDFDGGRGEAVRLAFHMAGIGFEDIRLSFAEFNKMRQDARFNSVPILEIDGAQVSQSNAMSRYVGKLAGLYPEDDLQALYCDEVMGAVEDVNHYLMRTIGLEGDELKNARQALVGGWLTTFVRGLDELLARGGGRFFAGGKLTVADLTVFVQMRSLRSGNLDHVPVDLVDRLAPKLVEHQERVAAHPGVAAYYASRI